MASRHQGADLPSQADSLQDSLEEIDEADETADGADGGDGLRCGSEPDLPSGEDGITGILHRLVKRCGVRLFGTTQLPYHP